MQRYGAKEAEIHKKWEEMPKLLSELNLTAKIEV
jgi:hypothetical protein